MRNFGDTPSPHAPHMSMRLPRYTPPGGIAPLSPALHYLAGHCTSYYPVQCSPISCIAPSTSATLRSHKLRHGSHSNSHTGHYTSYGTLHLLRDAAPDQNGCTAYGSGAAPTRTSTTADHNTTRANFNATTAGPTQRNDRSTSTHGRQYPKPRHVSDLPDRGLNSFRI